MVDQAHITYSRGGGRKQDVRGQLRLYKRSEVTYSTGDKTTPVSDLLRMDEYEYDGLL